MEAHPGLKLVTRVACCIIGGGQFCQFKSVRSCVAIPVLTPQSRTETHNDAIPSSSHFCLSGFDGSVFSGIYYFDLQENLYKFLPLLLQDPHFILSHIVIQDSECGSAYP